MTIAAQISIAFADTMDETVVSLVGFSYNMDGSEIETEYRYFMSAIAHEYDDRLELINTVVLFGQQDMAFPSGITLEKQDASMFSTYIPTLNLSMIIETNHSEFYVDVFSEDVCVAFGGHRVERIANYFERKTVIGTMKDWISPPVERMYAANELFCEENGMLRNGILSFLRS